MSSRRRATSRNRRKRAAKEPAKPVKPKKATPPPEPEPEPVEETSQLQTLYNNYYELIRNNQKEESKNILNDLRIYILCHGGTCNIWGQTLVNEQQYGEDELMDTVRGKAWKILLGIKTMDSQLYIQTISSGREAFGYVDIRRDTPRTFPNVEVYRDRVPEKVLVRLLNTHCLDDESTGYVQGMNGIAGALLFCMPEIDGFYCFNRLIEELPTYWNKTYSIVGAWAGALLVHDCLKFVSPEAFSELEGANIHPYVYAYPAITSYYAVSPPLSELLKLYDFLFSFGLHYLIICCTAHILTSRDEINNPEWVNHWRHGSRNFPSHDAKTIITKTLEIVQMIKENDELWQNIRSHGQDFVVAQKIKDHCSKKIILKSNKSHRRFESIPITESASEPNTTNLF